jgi:hypothetical protein
MPRDVELSSIELTAICRALYSDGRDLQLAAGSLPDGHKDKPFFKRTGDEAIALLSRIQAEFSDKAGETVVLILQDGPPYELHSTSRALRVYGMSLCDGARAAAKSKSRHRDDVMIDAIMVAHLQCKIEDRAMVRSQWPRFVSSGELGDDPQLFEHPKTENNRFRPYPGMAGPCADDPDYQ